MFGPSMKTTRYQQVWIRTVIFVGLYLMLLLSVTQCALVLYLYGTAQVDGLTTPSLIIGLIASFLSVPFVVIHTILSWQYRKAPGLNMPRNALHMACSHLPRVMVAMWLAASVAGLVVVSKQATCVSLSEAQQYWKAGMGCQIHRGTVILSILAFFTTSALFFCFQVCERPYDASLLGLYTPQRPPRDGSIFSESSWESETLKNEIFYLCRHPDAGPGNGELYWSPNDSSLFETPVRPPSIRYPGPTRVRPQLHVNTHTNSVRPSIVATSLTEDTSPRVSPVDETAAGSMSLRSDVSPLSRNPSMTSTLQPGTEAAFTRPPPVPKIPNNIPEVPVQANHHKRQKSSVSSRKFLPRDWDLSKPLSEDPQIRALASPPLSPEIEQSEDQSEKDDVPELPTLLPSAPAPARTAAAKDPVHSSNHIQTRRRSMTAPGNPPPVLPPVPLVVRKSRTSNPIPSSPSIHHPHHPNYTPKSSTSENLNRDGNTRPYTVRNEKNNNTSNNHIDNKRPLQRHKSTARLPPHRQPSLGHGHGHYTPHRVSPSQASLSSHGSGLIARDHSQKQRFRTSNSSSSFPRNAQFSRPGPPPPMPPSYYQRQQYYHQQHQQHQQHKQQQHMIHPSPSRHHTLSGRPPYVRRFHSNDGRGFDPSRTLPPIPRSDDTATLYPSTRRPRSSTYGGSPSSSHAHENNNNNNTTQEGGSASGGVEPDASATRHASLSLAEGGVALDADREIVNKKNTYRGAERTSICGGL